MSDEYVSIIGSAEKLILGDLIETKKLVNTVMGSN